MRTSFIVAVAVSTFAASASAAPSDAPYVLSAAHEDFLMQLEEAALAPDEVGTAASVAAVMWTSHNEAEERIVLPLLGLTEAVSAGKVVADPEKTLASLAELQAELPLLFDDQVEVVGALVELFAAADTAGRPDISRLAKRMIWHEMADAEVLYPAAVLVGSTVQASVTEVDQAVTPNVSEALN